MKNRKIIKRRKKKGFTLIELLAVILILGIIALIAIPTVNNVIKESRIGAFKSTVQNYITAIEQQCQLEQLRGDDITKYYVFEDGVALTELNIKGEIPTNGSIVVDEECNVNVVLNKDNYIAVKDEDSTEVEIIEEEYYVTGTEVTYDPGDSTYSTWNVLKDNGETVTLLLNTNIGEGNAYYFYWAGPDDYEAAGGIGENFVTLGPITVTAKLNELTSSWNSEAKANIRLIKAEEILEVLGVNEWDGEKLYIDTKSNVAPDVLGSSKYAWLFENGEGPYWTSTVMEQEVNTVYSVIINQGFLGTIEIYFVSNGITHAVRSQIRPVITISKTSLQ